MTQQEYTALVNRAKQLSYEYYVLAQPTVSDAQFDALVSEIEQAESEHPEWTLADSPTQQVGSDLQDNGRRLVRHRTRMLSCQKAQTQEAVTKWMMQAEKKLEKVNDLHYVLEWKLDGISCSLVYQDGRLISAATRGDKDCGQDLLAHVMRMPSVPQHINMTGRVEVRGEIVCPKAELAALGYKDCRTAAAALTNQAVPSREVQRLVFLAWQMDSDEQPFGTETAGMVVAGEHGFKTSGYLGCWGNDVLASLDDFAAKREALEWPTDGVVIKIDCKPLAASLGYTEHHPKSNIAYKFGAQKTVTRVLRIEVSVGSTGKRTPVAYLEPVMIMGREVKQASLYSERKMTELGVTEGCTVEVGLSNDVTPKIYRVIDTATETTTDGTDNHAEPEVIEETTNCTDCTDNEVFVHATVEPIMADSLQLETSGYSSSAELEQLRAENQQLQEQIAQMANQPRPRRQRKPRKPRVEHQTSSIDHQPSDASRQTSSTLKAVGMVAAATVALFVIYETGLLIPMGLIGLATGGILK